MAKATILMYHNIAKPPRGVMLRSLYVTPDMFRFQMWYIKKAGYQVVSLDEIADSAQHSPSASEPQKRIALTFDDGFADFYHNAVPILRQYGFTATVYLVSDRIGSINTWDAHQLNAEKPLMNWQMINELKQNGITFGSHTRTHPFLTELSAHQAEEEIAGSKAALEEQLGCPVNHFCYPSGNYNDNIVELVKNAGYKTATVTAQGYIHPGDDPFTLKRLFIKYRTYPPSFLYKLHAQYS